MESKIPVHPFIRFSPEGLRSRPVEWSPSGSSLLVIVGLTWLGLFVLRWAGPADLSDNGQERVAAYVLDCIRNGRWICQWDGEGQLTSKPPLYTWLAASFSLPVDHVSRLTLYLPCGLAMLGIVSLVFRTGSSHFGWKVGLLAGLAMLLSPAGAKLVFLARSDTLFGLAVWGAALCAYRAWYGYSGWTSFWLCSAAAMLTKGPLGLVLALGGLTAAFWEKSPPSPNCPWRRRLLAHLPGTALFVMVAGGWFVMAFWEVGHELIDTMIGRELVGHAVRGGDGRLPGQGFYKPFLYFLSRFAPWSLLTCVGLWRVWKRPSEDPSERRWERFLFWHFVVGLTIFSIAPHQRADHLFPLLPAAALLAGREVVASLRPVRPRSFFMSVAAGSAVAIMLIGIYYYGIRSRERVVVETQDMQDFARFLQAEVGSEFPLVHVDSPFALQFYLNTRRPQVPLLKAARLLLSDWPTFVVIQDPEHIHRCVQRALAAEQSATLVDRPLYTISRWPKNGSSRIHIVSNQPRLKWTQSMATYVGPIQVQMRGLELRKVRGRDLSFSASAPEPQLRLINESPRSQQLQIRIHTASGVRGAASPSLVQSHVIEAGQDQQIEIPPIADLSFHFEQNSGGGGRVHHTVKMSSVVDALVSR